MPVVVDCEPRDPVGHRAHELAPALLEKVAIGQGLQLLEPGVALKEPGGQGRQINSAQDIAKVPTGHEEHTVAPAVGLNRPALQGIHGESTPGAKVPTGQMVQIVLPAAVLLKPDSHA